MSKRVAKLNAEQKKEMFWSSIHTQTLANLRDTLAATGIEAHTRNEQTEKTSIMEASQRGRQKSLDTLLDWYERRRELRTKGWIDLKDENGRTALMLAAMEGQVDCMESLLKFGAKFQLKDDAGKTWLELAREAKKQKAVDFIEYTLKPAEEEEVVVEEDGSILTGSQRSKLKKRELQAKEGGGGGLDAASSQPAQQQQQLAATRDKSAKPVWDEVQRLFDSFDELKPLHDVSVNRTAAAASSASSSSSAIDPALLTCHWLRVLKLKLDGMTDLGSNLAGLVELQQLILSGSAKLRSIPPLLQPSKLRVLEAEGCQLDSIAALGPSLEVVNVSNNRLTSLDFLAQCVNLQSLNASRNLLVSVADVPWPSMAGRLADVKLGRNKLKELPQEMGALGNLVTLEAEENLIQRIPIDFLKLKKLKLLTLNGNPIQDPKLLKICNSAQKSPKELFSKLEKVEERAGKTQKKGKGGGNKKKEVESEEEEEEEDKPTSDLELDDDEI